MTVTVRGVSQSSALNVKGTAETVPSVVSLEESPIVTSAVGSLSRTTVNWDVPLPSVVTRPDAGVTVTPAVSSSVFVTETSSGSMAV